MLHDIEIYNYKGEFIMFVLNTETEQVEWCACNYRTYADLESDFNEIINLTTLEELHSFKATLPNDTHTVLCMQELKYHADVVRRALHNKQDDYMYDFNQLFFDDVPNRKIKTVVYKLGENSYSLVALNSAGTPIWCHGGYRGHIQVMKDVRLLQELDDEEQIKLLPGCGIELHSITDYYSSTENYCKYLEQGAMSGQIIRIEF